jgi:hypothetical protein
MSKRALDADISALIKVREDTIALLERFPVVRSEQPSRLRLTSSDPAGNPVSKFPDLARCLAAHFATTLEPDDNTPLSKAFRKLKLNPDDPWDWRRLAGDLAWLLWPPSRPIGRPTDDKEILLLEQVIQENVAKMQVRSGLPSKRLSASAVAQIIYDRRLGKNALTLETLKNKLSTALRRTRGRNRVQ